MRTKGGNVKSESKDCETARGKEGNKASTNYGVIIIYSHCYFGFPSTLSIVSFADQ